MRPTDTISYFNDTRTAMLRVCKMLISATALLFLFPPASAAGKTASVNPTARFMSTMKGFTGNAMPYTISQKNDRDRQAIYLPIIIRVENEDTPLPAFATELHRRGTIVLATVPEERLGELASHTGIHRLEAYASATPEMTSAREFCRLQEAISPTPQFPTALDGTGVVVGFTDIGFDPNHLNFLDNDGNTRVKKLVNYTFDSPVPQILETQEEISSWSTDNADETHATHVAGILSGSYTADNMQGVAPGAEIVATTSPLYDALLLAGCEEIIKYADAQGKPAVINISISSDIGPHDGTTLFNRYMESITEDATVCISAANDGVRTGFATGTTSAGQTSIRTYFREYPHLSPLRLNGTVDIWSDNNKQFRITLLTQDMQTGELHRIPVAIDPANGTNEWILCSKKIQETIGNIPFSEMPEFMEGYIHVAGELNPENNRYNVALRCSYVDTTTTDPYKAHVLFGVEVEAEEPGTVIEFYSTPGIFFTKYKDTTAATPVSARTVNDFCAGDGPICVGSLDSQNRFTSISGSAIDFPRLNIGGVSYFSSYGTLSNGKILPDICAPGAQLVSSLSRQYCDMNPDYPPSLATVSHENNGSKHYWGPMQGTSMSSPFAAGVAALWLQANPHLDGKQTRDIALATASPPQTDTSNPQWGHGVLDAAAGLEMARNLAGTDNVGSIHQEKLSVKVNGKIAYISLLSSDMMSLRILSPDGRLLTEHHPGTPDFAADCNGYPGGIYIVCVTDSHNRNHSVKVALY